MSTKIEWTDDSWNPIRARDPETGKVGWHCEKVSPGCVNCYAESMNHFRGTKRGYTSADRRCGDIELFLDEKMLTAPLRWRKPRRVFVCSMTDLFGEWVPDEWIDRMFAVMALARRHTFQVLTKRADRAQRYLSSLTFKKIIECCNRSADGGQHRPGAYSLASIDGLSTKRRFVEGDKTAYWPVPKPPLPNVWLGVSAEDQQRLDERVPHLLATPAAVRFVSAEPLLGPLRIPYLRHGLLSKEHYNVLDWVIVGGESGPGARPCDVAWVRSIVQQCRDAGVACFTKQLGAQPFATPPTSYWDGQSEALIDDDGRIWPALRDTKGGDPAEWPEYLRVREFPEVRS